MRILFVVGVETRTAPRPVSGCHPREAIRGHPSQLTIRDHPRPSTPMGGTGPPTIPAKSVVERGHPPLRSGATHYDPRSETRRPSGAIPPPTIRGHPCPSVDPYLRQCATWVACAIPRCAARSLGWMAPYDSQGRVAPHHQGGWPHITRHITRSASPHPLAHRREFGENAGWICGT